jgi:hypothetical protein|nr:MAG TPA: hypothetical protein [Caudoviricetes sp.]
MSRLIDADKIIDSLGNSDMDFAIGAVIDEQPTVFDVDKVVERLEEEKKRAFKLCLGTNDSTQRLRYIEKEQTIALAIEIVKGGGTE